MLILKILGHLGSKRSHSEQDLLNMTIAAGSNETKTSIKHRILTSIPGFGGSSSSSTSSSSTSANHQQQQMMENDK